MEQDQRPERGHLLQLPTRTSGGMAAGSPSPVHPREGNRGARVTKRFLTRYVIELENRVTGGH
jgi:hypothetical protein